MDRSEVITLIGTTYTQDDAGVFQQSETSREVYCNVSSVTRAEFFDAGRSGLNPEYRFTMFQYDYRGESIVKYKGKRFAVYRTYIARNDMIEVYVQREGGTNRTVMA